MTLELVIFFEQRWMPGSRPPMIIQEPPWKS
jgi:hypothetical protein